MVAGSNAFVPDPWLSGLLQRQAFRLANDLPGNAELKTGLSQAPLFVTAKPNAIDVETIGRLEDVGFRVVDTALTFDTAALRTDVRMNGRDIRLARPDDRAGVAALAGRAFRLSRFHLDPMLPNRIADTIKASWADNFFDGRRGDGMVVGEKAGLIVGFLQLLRSDNGVLVIDLIAVAPEMVRHGIASAMIDFAWRNGTGNGSRPSSLRVGTQAANIASCRLYESLGFRLCRAAVVLHHHGTGGCYPDKVAA
jgi:ribosomal protein S18 acetylase RimI-like enzyme